MIKLMYCLHRKTGISLEEFSGHLVEHHARLALADKTIRRYAVYPRLPNDPIYQAMAQAGSGAVEPYDGAICAWYDDAAAVAASMQGHAMQVVRDDEQYFVDAARSSACLVRERVVVEPAQHTPYVLFECLRRLKGMSRKDYMDHWEHHQRIGRRANQMNLLMGYIQNTTLLEGDRQGLVTGLGPESWDGITNAWFESIPKMKALMASHLAAVESFEDEKTFIDHSRSVFLVTRAHVVRDIVR